MEDDERRIHLIGLTAVIILLVGCAEAIIYTNMIDVFDYYDWQFWVGIFVITICIIFQGMLLFNTTQQLVSKKGLQNYPNGSVSP